MNNGMFKVYNAINATTITVNLLDCKFLVLIPKGGWTGLRIQTSRIKTRIIMFVIHDNLMLIYYAMYLKFKALNIYLSRYCMKNLQGNGQLLKQSTLDIYHVL